MGNLIEITDFNAEALDVYARLTEAQLLNKDKPEEGLFIAESPKVVMRALDAGYEPVSILTEDRNIKGEAAEVIDRCSGIPVYTAPFEVLTRLGELALTGEFWASMVLSLGRIAVGYVSSSRIAGTWFAWVFDYLEGYVLVWINLAYILLNVFVVISFFQTYACRRYVLMSFASVLFPIKGVLMFAVRNNKGMNYRDYVRGEQRRRYEMYQQYTSQNGGSPYGGYNPYGSRPGTPSGDPYQSPRSGDSAPDPFDGLGSSGNSRGTASSSDDDPFEEFKK